MEFKQLESFVAVIDAKSFSKAAEQLFLTQPTVSTQIAALERELDMKLLIRAAKEIRPTREGRVFYRYAKELLEKREQAVLSLRNLKQPQNAIISIGASSIPARHYLPQLVADFQKQNRNVTFRIYSYDSIQIVQNISDGKIEIGMTGIYVKSSQCTLERMAYDRWIVITPNNERFRNIIAESSFSLTHLVQERFICREQGSGTRKDVDHFLIQLGINPSDLHIVAEIDDTESIIELVSKGLGISIVSQRSAESFRRYGKILTVKFDRIVPSREIYLVKNQEIPLSSIAQKFYDFALKYYQP